MTVVVPKLTVERRLLAEHSIVIACDEVGRGAIAGPVAVGAAMMDAASVRKRVPQGLRDSKLVTERRRPDVARRATQWVNASAVGWSSAAEIDEIGIMRALGTAAHRAIADVLRVMDPGRDGLNLDDAVLLLDGNYDYITPVGRLGFPVRAIVKADRDCASAAAASVIAKVARDAHMIELHERHPQYDWQRNKGYASADHREAIRAHGLSPFHRASWAIADAPTLF
jgi:ribonuclease HII